MKSLEIIKRKINEIYGFDDKWEEVEELETIKKDLEVLEIISKKKVELELLECLLEYKTNEKILDAYNSNPSRIQLTLEELLNLKQWLERGNLDD